MSAFGRVIAAAVALGSAAAIAGLSQVPWTPVPGPEAMVRLSWRARGERLEVCRQLSAEELAELPPHMRQEQVCEGTTAEYRLRVEVDGEERVDQLVQGSGEVQVRPLYVYRELVLPPGEHTVRVEVERAARHSAGDAEDEDEKAEETGSRRRAEAAVPRQLRLERRLNLRPREVVLITYDAERRDLVLVATPPS
ncbi:MAG TPA: hypothetical protein VIQ27_10200 [Gemmatimonadales bacterium]